MKTLALALAVVTILGPQGGAARQSFDPVGKWMFSTKSDTGQNLTGTLEITGAPGAYTGQAVTSTGRTLPVSEIFTSPNGFIMILQLTNSSVIARVVRGTDGKFTGGWAEITQTVPLVAERGGG